MYNKIHAWVQYLIKHTFPTHSVIKYIIKQCSIMHIITICIAFYCKHIIKTSFIYRLHKNKTNLCTNCYM